MAADALAFALPDAVADWLLTYLVHSTLLLGGAWLVTTLARRLPVAAQETLWRTALFGAFVTASVQVSLGYDSFAGRLAVPAPPVALVRAAPPPAPVIESVPLAVEAGGAAEAHEDTPASAPPPVAITAPGERTGPGLDRLPFGLAVLWSAGAALALLRALRTRRRLRARLSQRTPLESGPLRETLDRLTPGGHVRLSAADGLAGPVAFGIRRPEICLPQRAARELPPRHQEAMLAHETAHHRRRDPLWLALGRGVGSFFFFQPLNALAARRLRDTAEVLCDAWAVERTGQRRALAECLATVAGWMVHAEDALPVPAMARRDSAVERRVQRLLDGSATPPAPVRGLLWALAPLLLVTALAPAVGRAAIVPAPATAPSAIEPHDDLDEALAALDAEIEGLAGALDALAHLVAQVDAAPPELTRGVDGLRARLAALRADRTALIERIRNELESGR